MMSECMCSECVGNSGQGHWEQQKVKSCGRQGRTVAHQLLKFKHNYLLIFVSFVTLLLFQTSYFLLLPNTTFIRGTKDAQIGKLFCNDVIQHAVALELKLKVQGGVGINNFQLLFFLQLFFSILQTLLGNFFYGKFLDPHISFLHIVEIVFPHERTIVCLVRGIRIGKRHQRVAVVVWFAVTCGNRGCSCCHRRTSQSHQLVAHQKEQLFFVTCHNRRLEICCSMI